MIDYLLYPSCFDVVHVTGPDAARFLQGQVTCDVATLAPGACTPGAALTNKGRVFALFFLMNLGDGFAVVLNQGLGEVFTSQLRKYLPFYKCQFASIPEGVSVMLACGAKAMADLRGMAAQVHGSHVFTLSDDLPAAFAWLPAGTTVDRDALPPSGTATQWQCDAMRVGHFPFDVQDVERYTAQELRLEHHGYVNFGKGCYTGQEIVARMHYRGKAKKVLCRLEFSLPATADVAQVVLRDDHGNPSGDLFKAMRTGPDTWRALAFLAAGDGPVPPAVHLSGGSLEAVAPL